MKFFIWNKKTNTLSIHTFLSFIGFRKNDLPFWIYKDNIIYKNRKYARNGLPDFSECEKCAHG